jgi:hypothetical protein
MSNRQAMIAAALPSMCCAGMVNACKEKMEVRRKRPLRKDGRNDHAKQIKPN